ncbi:MAG: hypothetical protein KBF73_13410, partial [Flavobacteriales bacterium]|nr:hypothetical protein [Flavobacteriales bacterium]
MSFKLILSLIPRILFFLFIFSFFSSCDTQPTHKGEVNPEKYKQPLMDANKSLVALEQKDI